MDTYSAPQAARILGVSRMTIIRWIRAGQLTATTTRQGHKLRYWISAAEVERMRAALSDLDNPRID